jgi:hypothetical protein
MPLHRTIMVVDVAGFANPVRTMAHQEAVHEGMYAVLRAAFDEVGVDLDDTCTVEDRGDGALILVPPEVPKNLLTDRFLDRLVAELRRYNAVHAAEAMFQLRVSLHAGEVRQNSRGAVSQAIILASRILEAAAAKQALDHTAALLALIASDAFYHEVIEQDPAAEPDMYRRIPVQVKETSIEAWLRLSDGVGVSVPFPVADVFIPAQAGPADPPVLGILPARELDQLRGWLSGIAVRGVPTLVRRAAGPGVPLPPGDADAWQVFQHLADFNAGGDGLPPAFVFLELLSGQLTDSLAAGLRGWLTDRVGHLRLRPVLQALRARASPVDPDTRLHLLVVVEHDAIDPDRCQLSFWRQDDPDEWPPQRGDTREVQLADLQDAVDDLIVDAERAWSGHGGSAALEFVLPRALLRLPVHRWYKERSSGDPRLLCLAYPVVVRSLERMRSTHWHRVWHERWRILMNDPEAAGVLYADAADLRERHRLDAILNSPQWSAMVLAEPPLPRPVRGPEADEFTAALRAGLPALIWHPTLPADALSEIVSWLAESGGMRDLSARAHAARLAALRADPVPFDADLALDLVVLWDNPERRVVLDQL